MINKVLFCIYIILLSFPTISAQVNTFSNIIDVTGPGGFFTDLPEQVVCLKSGDFMILTQSRYPDEIHNLVGGISLTKIDTEGELIWKKLYKSPTPPLSLLPANWGLLPLQDGGFMMAGSSYTETTNEDMFLMRLDSAGNELWFKRYGGSQWERGRTSGILQGEDGNILFLAEKGIYNDLPTWDIYLVNFDKNGKMIWEKTYGGDQFERSVGFEFDKDGGLLIGGHSRSAPAEINGDGILIKTDSEGNVLWQKLFGGSREEGAVQAQATHTREGYIATVYIDTTLVENQEPKTVHFTYGLDAQGDIIWERHFASQKFKAPDDFVELEDGSIIIVGFDENVPQIPDEDNIYNIRESYGWMAKLSSEGELLWEKHFYDDRAITPVMGFRDVELTLDGGLIMTGQIWNRNEVYVEELDSLFVIFNRDIWVVKTDLDGCMYPDCGDNDVVYVDIPDLSPSVLTASEVPLFQVFPNPTRHQTQLYFPNTNLLKGKEVVLEVFDLQGRLVFEQELLGGKERSFWELAVSDWRRGMYVLQLKVEGEVAATQRLVVE
ncbi:MAG: T9SS type A sorting domain-containing protein [Chitinophagales bacterium]